MCYNISTLTLNKLKYAKRIGASAEDIDRLEKEYERLKEMHGPGHFQSSFGFPKVPIHRNTEQKLPVAAELSLIPRYATNKKQADTDRRRYRTANIKVETANEKRMYKDVLKERWCLLILDGFYEYYHHNKKAHPFYIQHRDGDPLAMVGLWDEWIDPSTGEVITSCNILTRSADGFMKTLHNNPKLTEGRMPIILRPGIETEVLNDIGFVIDKYKQLSLPLNELNFHPVGKLVGKDSIGNMPEAQNQATYDTLVDTEIEKLMTD